MANRQFSKSYELFSPLHAYVMCVLDYDFMVLDNAFLIHRPGIKTRSSSNGYTH